MMKILTFLRKNKHEILAAFVLSITLFFFAPVSVYISNANSLGFNLWDIWYSYLLISFIAFIVFSAITLLLKRFFPNVTLFITALSICCIIQGNFLITNLGVLDGHEIQWDNYTRKTLLEILIWVAIIGLFFILRKSVKRNLGTILILLFAFQFGSSAIGLYNNPIEGNSKSTYFNTNKEFEFSKDRNVILIILDTFRGEELNEVLQKYPEYKEDFKDFTYYQDSLAGFPTTLPSVPLILTGKYYDNSIPISEFIAGTQKDAIPTFLKNNGFIVENYSMVPYYNAVYDNLTHSMPDDFRDKLILEQFIVSGIRYVPIILKPLLVNQYYQGEDYYHKDMVEFAANVYKTNATDRKETFKFYHFSGAHGPYQLDSSMNRVKNGSYIDQAAASLSGARDLLKELKKAGVYDNSLIFIMGDHGTQTPVDYLGTTPSYSTHSLLLAKQIGQQQNDLQISNSPVSLSDIPKTIADEIGLANSYPGYSIFQPIPPDRTRKFFYYHWTHSNWAASFFTKLYEFNVNGPADQIDSYQLIKEYSENKEVNTVFPVYQFGDNVIDTLLTSDIYRWYNLDNIYYQVDNNKATIWSAGPKACLNITVQPTNQTLTLSLNAKPYLAEGKIEDQRMVVLLDDNAVVTFTKDDTKEFKISSQLAAQITQDGKIGLCFELLDATKSPFDYGLSKDTRLLGYSIESIVIK